jgi:hypothetical protein
MVWLTVSSVLIQGAQATTCNGRSKSVITKFRKSMKIKHNQTPSFSWGNDTGTSPQSEAVTDFVQLFLGWNS